MAINVPFVDLKKTPGTGIPFVDFDSNNPAPIQNIGGIIDSNTLNSKPNNYRPQVRADQRESAATPGGNVLGSSTGSPGGSSAADLAYLNNQEGLLRSLLGRSQTTLDQGLANLSDSYNREVSGANQQRSRVLGDFGMQREDTTKAKQTALNRVDTNARVLNNSLRQILGLAGGSGSSAYQYAAPNAVARQSSGERNDVLSNFAANDRDISIAESRATEDFSKLLDDLARQRSEKEQQLRSGVIESEQNTNRSLAELSAQRSALQGKNYSQSLAAQQPYANAISERQSQLDNLFNQFRSPTLSAAPVNVQAPTLRDYMVEGAGITGSAQQPTYDRYYNPLRRDEEEQPLY